MSLKFKFLDPYCDDVFYAKLLSFLLKKTETSDIYHADDTLKYLDNFLVQLEDDISNYKIVKLNNYKAFKDIATRLIKIKLDPTMPDVDLHNLHQYFHDLRDNYFVSQLVDIVTDKFNLTEHSDYINISNDIIESISLYNQLKLLDDSIIAIDNYINDDEKDSSILGKIQDFKNIVDKVYHQFTEINFNKVNNNEEIFWYSDENSVEKVALETTTYLRDSFVVFETGLPFIDNFIHGITSSKVYIIAAPSNNGKSLMMTNLVRNIIDLNKQSFDDDGKDVILYYTLEDDKFNFQKRAISIFGNMHPTLIRDIHYFFRDKSNEAYTKNFNGFLKDVLKESIISHTNGVANLVIVQAEEGTTAVKDIIQMIERLKFKGFRVKMCVIDYIEAMATSIHDAKQDEYSKQGQIVREQRRMSRLYKIPVITASQLQRSAVDITIELNNALMGDSIRKIQFADFVIMLRQTPDRKIGQEEIDKYLSNISKNKDVDTLIDCKKLGLVPVECAVTKAKDGKPSGTHIVLKNDSNLRIETEWSIAINNIKESRKKSHDLQQKFRNLTLSDLSFDVGNDDSVDNEIF